MKKGTISITTTKKLEFADITTELADAIRKSQVKDGVLYVYNPHTTAGLTINEGADPAVQSDILAAFRLMVPPDYDYRHMEGNSPAHVMASLTGSAVNVFIDDARLMLGTWQRIFFCDFDGPRTRTVWWRILQCDYGATS